jgi:hypothetical protein
MRSSTRKDAAPLAQKWLKEIASRSQSFAEVGKWKWKEMTFSAQVVCPALQTSPLTSRKPLILPRNLLLLHASMATRLLVLVQALRTNCVLPRLPEGFCSEFRTN